MVQGYIPNPLLIGGRKFDLRLYILVTSFNPLRIYMFEEGLARFSTEQYSLNNLKCRYAHLTNYSVNKKSKKFVQNTSDGDACEGDKWSLTSFWSYLEKEYGLERVQKIRKDVEGVVIKTLIAAEDTVAPTVVQRMKSTSSCYELFGFDVLLDDRLKAWIIEVNISPSLAGTSPLDVMIKGKLMADVFHLVGFSPLNKRLLKQDEKVSQLLRSRAGALLNEEERKLCEKNRHLLPSKKTTSIQDGWRVNKRDPSSIQYSLLSKDDWLLILQCESEMRRMGHFSLLFPNPDNVLQYLSLFKSPRFNNCLLAKWILDGMSRRQSHKIPRYFAPRCDFILLQDETKEVDVQENVSSSSSPQNDDDDDVSLKLSEDEESISDDQLESKMSSPFQQIKNSSMEIRNNSPIVKVEDPTQHLESHHFSEESQTQNIFNECETIQPLVHQSPHKLLLRLQRRNEKNEIHRLSRPYTPPLDSKKRNKNNTPHSLQHHQTLRTIRSRKQQQSIVNSSRPDLIQASFYRHQQKEENEEEEEDVTCSPSAFMADLRHKQLVQYQKILDRQIYESSVAIQKEEEDVVIHTKLPKMQTGSQSPNLVRAPAPPPPPPL